MREQQDNPCNPFPALSTVRPLLFAGLWRAYAGAGTSLKLVSNDKEASSVKAISKRRYIPGGGKFILGQLYQGSMESFNPGSVYRVRISLQQSLSANEAALQCLILPLVPALPLLYMLQ